MRADYTYDTLQRLTLGKIGRLPRVVRVFVHNELRRKERHMTDVAMDRPRRIRTRHPNASRALTHGSGLGALLVWIAGLGGLEMPPEIAAAFAGVLASLFLLVGRRGIKGTIHDLWNGSGD